MPEIRLTLSSVHMQTQICIHVCSYIFQFITGNLDIGALVSFSFVVMLKIHSINKSQVGIYSNR